MRTLKQKIYLYLLLGSVFVLPFAVGAETTDRELQLQQIAAEAHALHEYEQGDEKTLDRFNELLEEGYVANGLTAEDAPDVEEADNVAPDNFFEQISWDDLDVTDSAELFVLYNFGTSAHHGAGERAGVIHSWQTLAVETNFVFPNTEAEWNDVLKIASGRWPSATNAEREEWAAEQFEKVYKRKPNFSNAHDDAAVTVMAYGLRPEAAHRNLAKESKAIGLFESIFGSVPDSTDDWDTVRAIAYSGATR